MKLLPKEPLNRQLQQHVSFTDPFSKKAVEVKFATMVGGERQGCPVVEINGRFVIWELTDLILAAVQLFRETGILPEGTPKQIAAQKKRQAKGFAPVSAKEEKKNED